MVTQAVRAASRRWVFLKAFVIVFGTLVAGIYTVANVLALYYAKAYLLDRPALTVNMQVAQIGTDEQKYLLITLEFENSGVRPYDLTLKDLKPITLAKVAHGADGEPSYAIVKQISLPSVYPDAKSVVVHDVNGLFFSPGEKGRSSVATPVPGPGLYFVEFNAAFAYRSIVREYFWNRWSKVPEEPTWLSANGFVYVK